MDAANTRKSSGQRCLNRERQPRETMRNDSSQEHIYNDTYRMRFVLLEPTHRRGPGSDGTGVRRIIELL